MFVVVGFVVVFDAVRVAESNGPRLAMGMYIYIWQRLMSSL
jgi:hypothetical protein